MVISRSQSLLAIPPSLPDCTGTPHPADTSAISTFCFGTCDCPSTCDKCSNPSPITFPSASELFPDGPPRARDPVGPGTSNATATASTDMSAVGSDRAGPYAAADSDGAAAGGAILASLDGTSTGIDGIGKSIGDVLKGVEVGAAGSDAVGRCFHLMMTALKDGIKSGSLTGNAAAIGNEMVSTISSMPVVSRLGAASREEERAKRRGNNLLVPTINYSAFDVNQRNNQPRTSADAIRKAKERAANVILNAVQSVGDEQVQAYALRLFANKPQAAKIVLGSGLKVPDNTEKKLQMLDNLTSHASELFKSDGAAKGRVNDDQSSALQVLYDAIVEPCNANAASTATSTSSTPKLTTTDYQKVLPGSRATVQRRVKKSKDRKTKFKVGAKEEGLMYSRIKKRKGWSKVSKELQKKVVEWLKTLFSFAMPTPERRFVCERG